MEERIATLPVDPLMIKVQKTKNIINWLVAECIIFGYLWHRTDSSYWLGVTILALGCLAAFHLSILAMNASINAALEAKLKWHGLSDIRFNERGTFFAKYNSRRVKGRVVPNARGTLLEVRIIPLPE